MDHEINEKGADEEPEEEAVEPEQTVIRSEVVTQEPPASASNYPHRLKMQFRGKQIELDFESLMGPCIGQLVSAIVLLIAATTFPQHKNFSYSIVASVFAIVFSMLGSYLSYNTDMGNRRLFTMKFLGDVTIHSANATFLFVWWIISTGILTFDGPFVETGNGYLAAWTGFILSIIGLSHHVQPLKEIFNEDNLFRNGLLISSLVVICAVAKFVKEFGEASYALVIAIITVLLVLVQQYSSRAAFAGIIIYRGLAVLWLVSAVITTFRDPFTSTGNGYFAVWGGLFFCIKCAIRSYEMPAGDVELVEEDQDLAAV